MRSSPDFSGQIVRIAPSGTVLKATGKVGFEGVVAVLVSVPVMLFVLVLPCLTHLLLSHRSFVRWGVGIFVVGID